MRSNEGFTLVEALVALVLVLLVVVSITSGFIQQIVSNRYAQSRNAAITLAETRLEELLKFSASQMPGSSVDYIVERDHRFVVSVSDPKANDQFRRSWTISGSTVCPGMKELRVTVEYGHRNGTYPFRVALTSMRGG